MADEPRTVQYRAEACQMLVGSEGWRMLLEHITQRLLALDAHIFRMAPVPEREAAIGARVELVNLVRWVCETGRVPNPFDVARGALWSSLEPRHGSAMAVTPESPVLQQAVQATKARWLSTGRDIGLGEQFLVDVLRVAHGEEPSAEQAMASREALVAAQRVRSRQRAGGGV